MRTTRPHPERVPATPEGLPPGESRPAMGTAPAAPGGPQIRFEAHHRPALEAILALYAAAPLRRPVGEPPRIRRMFDHANVIHSAWCGARLVGLLRGWTDGAFDGYVCDLAVHPAWQKQGVGKGLLDLLAPEYPEVRWVLLASPLAREYYGRVGWEELDNAWALVRAEGGLPSYEAYRERFADLAARA